MNRPQDEFPPEYLLKYMKKERDIALSRFRCLQRLYNGLKAENEQLKARPLKPLFHLFQNPIRNMQSIRSQTSLSHIARGLSLLFD